ncbi:MAG: TIM barrel protein [Armatimonadota bacterium]
MRLDSAGIYTLWSIVIRIGFSCRPTVKHLKNPRPDGLGEYERVLDIIMQTEEWCLNYYNMPPETIGWGDYSQYKPAVEEMERNFGGLLSRIRDIAEIADIMLSMHTAAYNVPTSDDPIVLERSLKEIIVERRALEMCGGKVLYIHPGYVKNESISDREKLLERLSSLPESSVYLGIETDDVGIGDLETVLYLSSMLPNAAPVIDFAHMYYRGQQLDTVEDYLDVLSRAGAISGSHVFTHFSAIQGRKHIPLEGNKPDYHIFAEAAVEFEFQHKQELVILIESPLRELDAMRFRTEFERVYQQRAIA